MQKSISAFPFFPKTYSLKPLAPRARGMTLIETLVAITILTVAIVAPMSLTMQSLSASYYARDQVTAFNLAQEAIESVRAIRDGNILRIAYDLPDPLCVPMTLLCNIPVPTPFTIDTRDNSTNPCVGTPDEEGLATCDPLETNASGELYGYDDDPTWVASRFTRRVVASFVEGRTDEISVRVDVTWEAGPRQTRTVTLYENLYRWVNDGSVL